VTFTVKEKRRQEWHLKGLHSRIRFVCYQKGQNFPPHFDDPWVQSTTIRSHFSFVIYLSKAGEGKKSDFSGGDFAFLEQKKQGKETTVSELAKIIPEPGLVVIFPHQTLHESKPLIKGYKFIIRSDVMYDLVTEEKPQEQNLGK